MSIQLVVAVAANGVIGANGTMPWHLPEDLKHFRAVTTPGTLVMGRKTYESIGRPLPGRRSVVVTRDASWDPGHAEVVVAPSVEDALARAAQFGVPVHVIGGGEIYRQTLPLADAVEITEIHASPEGDTTFPPLGPEWVEVAREPHDGFAFVRYERRPDS